MEHFYVTLPSDSTAYYFPTNTIPNFRTKLATPLELQPNTWEVGPVEIFYPKWYKKRFVHNTIRLDSKEIIYPVKHYESLSDLITDIPQFWEPSKKEDFIRIFTKYTNKYQVQSKKFFNSCNGENSITVEDDVVSYFPARVYDGIQDLAKTVVNPANCCTSRVALFSKDNFDFALHETVYIYTDIIKPNLDVDSYVRL